MMWHILDFLEYGIRGVLLLYLCRNTISWKEKYAKQGKYFFLLLAVIWEFWINHAKWIKKLLYGEDMAIQRSSTSTVKLIFTILVFFLLLDFFCEGDRLLKAYLVLLYETILELSRFGLHGVWSLCIDAYSNWQADRVLAEHIPVEQFFLHIQILEYVWNLLLMVLYLGLTYLTIRIILKFCCDMRNIGRQGILFLMLSPAVGMVFDVLLRFLFFVRTGGDFDYIYDRHKGMYAVIPVMAFLCLLSIIYSTKIYEELMRVQEEKSSLLFYKQQLSDMTGHVQDMERLYDGIRSMRHDMNNYIADMEQLLCAGIRQDVSGVSVEPEARQYLQHMKNTMDTLTMKFHTGHPVTDVILNRKWQECGKEGISLISDFIYPAALGIEAFDLGIVMNNALDNAVEACRRCSRKEELHIRVHSYLKGRMFFLRIENDCDSAAIVYTGEDRETLRTTKGDDSMHGIGLKNMRRVVERYFGTMTHESGDDIFVLTIMLQGTQRL